MSGQICFIEQMVNLENESKYWFYKWTSISNLKQLREASEKTSKYHRPVAYFKVKLKHETPSTN